MSQTKEMFKYRLRPVVQLLFNPCVPGCCFRAFSINAKCAGARARRVSDGWEYPFCFVGNHLIVSLLG